MASPMLKKFYYVICFVVANYINEEHLSQCVDGDSYRNIAHNRRRMGDCLKYKEVKLTTIKKENSKIIF